jgi:predicted GNAT family N-acyltransferase
MTTYEIVTTADQMQSAFNLRDQVFVVEQKVPRDMEQDEFDAHAVHVIARNGEVVIGTGRLVIEGTKGHIGRIAVDQNTRGTGVGRNVMLELEKKAKELGLTELYLHAQTYAKRFYELLGYTPRGDVFDEAGIEHIEMFKMLQ